MAPDGLEVVAGGTERSDIESSRSATGEAVADERMLVGLEAASRYRFSATSGWETPTLAVSSQRLRSVTRSAIES